MLSPFSGYESVKFIAAVVFSVYRDQANSKGAVLEATVEYINSLRKDQQKMSEMAKRIEQLETQQRKLLLQREVC